MDLRQLEYIIEISKEKNITHAAEKIFISQSALNQQLLKLEKELGSKIFNRNNWELTEVGKVYIENAKKIIAIKKETYLKIADLLDNQKKELKIGIPKGRWIELFIYVLLKMQKKYKNLKLTPFELSVTELQKKVAQGDIDIGFVSLEKNQRIKNNYILLIEEEFVLISPKTFNISNKNIDSILKKEKFIFIDKNSTSRNIIDNYFFEKNISPNIIFETSNMENIVATVSAGIGCAIVPYYYASINKNKINIMSLNEEIKWDIAITYAKNTYIPKIIEDFIKFSKDFFISI